MLMAKWRWTLPERLRPQPPARVTDSQHQHSSFIVVILSLRVLHKRLTNVVVFAAKLFSDRSSRVGDVRWHPSNQVSGLCCCSDCWCGCCCHCVTAIGATLAAIVTDLSRSNCHMLCVLPWTVKQATDAAVNQLYSLYTVHKISGWDSLWISRM